MGQALDWVVTMSEPTKRGESTHLWIIRNGNFYSICDDPAKYRVDLEFATEYVLASDLASVTRERDEARANVEFLEHGINRASDQLTNMANWREGADSYDQECDNEPRECCEDVELMEKGAASIRDQLTELLATKEPNVPA
jgi:hypothetical protein